MRTIIRNAVLLWIVGVAATQAEDRNPLNATAVVDMGGFFLSTDIRVRLDGEGGMVGDPIDFDDTFGIDRFQRFRIDGLWRIKGKHSIRGTYFKNDRTGTNELSRDINFGDETYPLGATTTARWQLEVMQVSYDYAFKRSDKYELAAGIGLHVLHANLGMDATITGAGGSVFARAVSRVARRARRCRCSACAASGGCHTISTSRPRRNISTSTTTSTTAAFQI